MGYGHARYGRIDHHKLAHEGVVFVVASARLEVGGAHKKLAHEYHGEYHAHNTQRIGHGTSQSCTAARLMRVGKSLLRGNPTARSERYTEVLERLKKRLDTHTHR